MVPTSPLLSMRDIRKTFGSAPALIDSSLEVAPGEVMALIGQNGAGKSTMIKVLNGFFPKDAGEIEFGGAPWAATSPQVAQRGGISTIFQEINLIPFRTVTENIYLGRELRNKVGLLDWRGMDNGARELLKRFNVDIDVRQPLREFSTAIQQMVAIARAVSFEARLVIMDEPTSSLDEHEVKVLFETIRQLKAQGVAVIYVSHKLDELYEICDRVTIMRDGRTVAVSAISGLSKLQMVATMLGRDLAEVRKQGATAFTDAWPHYDWWKRSCVSTDSRRRRVVNASCDGSGRRDRRTGGAAGLPAAAILARGPIFGDLPARWRGEIPGAANRKTSGSPPTLSPPASAFSRRTARRRASSRNVGPREPVAGCHGRRFRVGQRGRGEAAARSSTASSADLGIKVLQPGAENPRAIGGNQQKVLLGPLVVHESEAGDPRRADTRDRCGRESRNPAADPHAGRRGNGGSDDLIGTGGNRRRGRSGVRPAGGVDYCRA
jgi:ribose transport system ATP-binding protein